MHNENENERETIVLDENAKRDESVETDEEATEREEARKEDEEVRIENYRDENTDDVQPTRESDNKPGDGTGEHPATAPLVGVNPQDDYGEEVPAPVRKEANENNPAAFKPHLPETEEIPARRTDHTSNEK